MSVPKAIQDIRNLRSRALDANKTVYVGSTGNDTTGDGSPQSPYRTITKALSMFPKNLNGKNATISMSAGTYSENVTIENFFGGEISFTGITNAVAAVTSLRVDNCTVIVSGLGFSTTASTGITIINGANFISTGTLTSTGTSTGISVTNLSSLNVTGAVTIRNASTAVNVTNNSKAHFNSLIGTSNTTGLSATNGSRISYGQNTMSATTAISTSNGGRVYTGSVNTAANTVAVATLETE